MHESAILHLVLVVAGLLFVAAVAAILVRKLRFPYTIGLLIVGILIGYLSHRVEFLVISGTVYLFPLTEKSKLSPFFVP